MTAEELQPNTVLVDKDGCQHKVLRKRGNLWLLSKRNNFRQLGHHWTLEEINERENHLLTPKP